MDEKPMKTLPNNLARLRTLNRLTQDAVAEELGVTRQAVAKWEAGKSVPDLNFGAALAKLYSVTLDDLYRYDEAAEGAPIPPKGRYAFGLVSVGASGEITLPKACVELFRLSAGAKLAVLADTNPENAGIALVPEERLAALKTFLERAGEDAE